MTENSKVDIKKIFEYFTNYEIGTYGNKRDLFLEESLLLKEYGIDIRKEGDKTFISYNPNHQNNVDTNSLINPKPFYSEVNGYPVYSIFLRKSSQDGDGNPLIYALKGLKNCYFENPERDIPLLFRHYVYAAKALTQPFDTLIKIPSNNKLNQIFFNSIKDILHFNSFYEGLFTKNNADVVFNNFLKSDWYQANKENPRASNLIQRVVDGFNKMNQENGGLFSFKYIPKFIRNEIFGTMALNEITPEIADNINDKNILIIDDTVSSGTSISQSANAIIQTFQPKSITFLTLLSPLDGKV